MNVNKLHSLINAKNLSKVKLSSMTGISDVTISNILKGADAKISSIEALASALNVSVGYFFDDEQKNTNISHVEGNNNILSAGGNNNVTFHSQAECEKEVELLRIQNKYLEEKLIEKDVLLSEKERLIQLLISK